MTPEAADTLLAVLSEKANGALAELCVDGWSLEGVTRRYLMKTHLPVLTFKRGADTLCFIVAPTDPSQRAFKRSIRFDLSYFSEDVADDQQGVIYKRDREQIERVAAWLRRWDG